jgi:hypothetical protein
MIAVLHEEPIPSCSEQYAFTGPNGTTRDIQRVSARVDLFFLQSFSNIDQSSEHVSIS